MKPPDPRWERAGVGQVQVGGGRTPWSGGRPAQVGRLDPVQGERGPHPPPLDTEACEGLPPSGAGTWSQEGLGNPAFGQASP